MYSSIKRIAKLGSQILIDDELEREGFLDGDERVSFLMSIINRRH